MPRSIADQLVALGVITAKHAKEIRKQAAAENPQPTVKVTRVRQNWKPRSILENPNTSITSSPGTRPRGHKTRRQHKRVGPTKK
jgi:hypothetical protein